MPRTLSLTRIGSALGAVGTASVLLLTQLTIPTPAIHAQPASPGCAFLNDSFDGLASGYNTLSPVAFVAGDQLRVSAGTPEGGAPFPSPQGPVVLELNGTRVATAAYPGTVTHTIPTTGTYSLSVRVTRGLVTWTTSCTPAADPASPNPADLPYGPDTCKQGYVWREAFAGDTVCVTPDRRDQAYVDNAAAEARREPNGGVYGPATCQSGYVWREARPEDLVCVTPETRTLTAVENTQANQHRVVPR
jgi:hypothetical protein